MFSFSYCVWYLAGTYHTWTNRWLKNKCPHVSHVSSLLVRWFPNAPIFDMLLVNHWTTSRYPWVNRLLRAVVDAECCSVLVWCSIPEYCSIPAIGAHICIIYIYSTIQYIYIYIHLIRFSIQINHVMMIPFHHWFRGPSCSGLPRVKSRESCSPQCQDCPVKGLLLCKPLWTSMNRL